MHMCMRMYIHRWSYVYAYDPLVDHFGSTHWVVISRKKKTYFFTTLVILSHNKRLSWSNFPQPSKGWPQWQPTRNLSQQGSAFQSKDLCIAKTSLKPTRLCTSPHHSAMPSSKLCPQSLYCLKGRNLRLFLSVAAPIFCAHSGTQRGPHRLLDI